MAITTTKFGEAPRKFTNEHKSQTMRAMPDHHPYQEKLYYFLDKIWSKLHPSIGACIASILILMAGISARGDWLLIVVHLVKQFSNSSIVLDISRESLSSYSLAHYRLQGVHWHILISAAYSYVLYFGLCGFLQWYFYIRQRDSPHEWKCQPKHFLTWEDERHEIILGTFGIGLGSVISGFLSCYTMNGGYTSLYYNLADHSWFYFVFSIPLVFLFMDGAFYYLHRMFHLPYFYKSFHKVHHRYKQPTPFSASAMHPVEFLILQSALVGPMFIIPVHWAVYIGCLLYNYYYGIIDHSGIKMESIWPWQPSTTFHDNHHEFFHTNFGFQTKLFDRLHGTLRKEDRIYSEDIFYGFGKKWEDANEEEKILFQNEQDIKKST